MATIVIGLDEWVEVEDVIVKVAILLELCQCIVYFGEVFLWELQCIMLKIK